MIDEPLNAVYQEVSRCNKCGFCQPACPVFQITGLERAVARGHNAHLRDIIEGNLTMTEEMKAPLFECLLCRACVSSCFPAVNTPENVVAGREAYLRELGQPRFMRFVFRRLLPDPSRLSRYIRLAAAAKNTGLSRVARTLGVLKWIGKDLEKAEDLLTRLPLYSLRGRARLQRDSPGASERFRVAYFVGCGIDHAVPEIGEAAIRVLASAGCSVQILDNVCCGLPAYGHGDLDAARHLARKNLDILSGLQADVIVTECASCSSFLKDYPRLLEGSGDAERAGGFSARVEGLSQWLEKIGFEPASSGLRGKLTFHDPCHLGRYQGMKDQPRALLKTLPGVEFLEMREADWCCGAAGTYNIFHHDQSMRILDRKMDNLAHSGADIVVTECPGCYIQLAYGVRRRGLPVSVLHLSQALDISPVEKP
ncbi:MAG: (Fe-S)-binding protein [Deltaproteobacteria bacterium]|nr:(Fe-S)-binding protein [Deltaproteobacteria bacterium]